MLANIIDKQYACVCMYEYMINMPVVVVHQLSLIGRLRVQIQAATAECFCKAFNSRLASAQ